jgi:hypothetical protein
VCASGTRARQCTRPGPRPADRSLTLLAPSQAPALRRRSAKPPSPLTARTPRGS